MPHYYENFLVYSGRRYSVYFHAEESTVSSIHEYFEGCDEIVQASLLYLVKRLADEGHIYDTTKFRIEDRKHRIYCFKPKKERFFCFFFAGKRVIITSAYTKKRQKLDRGELNRAVQIRNKYIRD